MKRLALCLLVAALTLFAVGHTYADEDKGKDDLKQAVQKCEMEVKTTIINSNFSAYVAEDGSVMYQGIAAANLEFQRCMIESGHELRNPDKAPDK